MPLDPGIRFPGESEDYRAARNRLLEAETELRADLERVAEQRRSLPLGGPVPEDYRFEEASERDGEVSFSELFEPQKDTLLIYSFMFPRHSGDRRPGATVGETGQLPLEEQPCPSCTSILALSTAPPATSRSESTWPSWKNRARAAPGLRRGARLASPAAALVTQ